MTSKWVDTEQKEERYATNSFAVHLDKHGKHDAAYDDGQRTLGCLRRRTMGSVRVLRSSLNFWIRAAGRGRFSNVSAIEMTAR